MSAHDKKKKMFHATVHVTRVEEWCVEADSLEEAQALIASGEGHRCSPSEALHADVPLWMFTVLRTLFCQKPATRRG